MIPPDAHDRELERCALVWCALDSDARTSFLVELERRDFYDPRLRDLFSAMRAAWRAGNLVRGYEIRDTRVVQVWSGLVERDRVALEELVDSEGAAIYVPTLGPGVVTVLRRLTKRRALLVAAEKIYAGDGAELSDDVLEWLVREDA